MKKIALIHLLLFACGTFGLWFFTIPAFGQDAPKMQKLQGVIEAQQKQLDAQQKQLDAQRQLLQKLQSQIKALANDADKEEVTVSAEKPPAKPPADSIKTPSPKTDGLSDAARYDQDSPTGSDFTYFDPALVINIPGTDTSIGLHGLAEFQIIHDSVGLNNNRFDTASIPVDGGPSQTKFSVNPSQLAISSTTKITKGHVNTMISMDFNGELDHPKPRLRIAYGEIIKDELGLGVLAGQSYNTMLDLSAVPQTLDFSGPAGLWQQRQPLLRFTKSVAKKTLMEFSLETPENVLYIDAEKHTRWPNVVVAGTWNAGGKYVKRLRMAGLASDLRAEDANGSTDSALGWAVTGSGKVDLPFLGSKDNFKFTLHFGDGYGTQIKGGPKDGVFNTVNSELETIGLFGGYGGIQHFWSERFHSNLVYGYVHANNPEIVHGDRLKSTTYVAADIIWNPYKKLSFGVEYLWGQRENKDGASGTDSRFIFSSRFDF